MTKRSYRKFKPTFKFQVVLDTLKGNKTQAEVSRKYNIHPQLIDNWRKEFFRRGPTIFEDKQEDKSKEKKIEELEKIIGRQTIEIQFLKKVLERLD